MAQFTHYIETSPDVEIAVTVHYDYSPAERMTWNHPGCSDSVDVYQIDTHKLGRLTTADEFESIKEAALDHAHKQIEAREADAEDRRYERRRERRERGLW